MYSHFNHLYSSKSTFFGIYGYSTSPDTCSSWLKPHYFLSITRLLCFLSNPLCQEKAGQKSNNKALIYNAEHKADPSMPFFRPLHRYSGIYERNFHENNYAIFCLYFCCIMVNAANATFFFKKWCCGVSKFMY